MPNYTQEQQQDINERVEKALAFIKDQQLALDLMSYKVFLHLDKDGSPLFAEKIKIIFNDTKYANLTTDKKDIETKDNGGEEIQPK